MSHEKIIEDFKIIEGFQKARIGSLKGVLRRAAQAVQDVHANAGYIVIFRVEPKEAWAGSEKKVISYAKGYPE